MNSELNNAPGHMRWSTRHGIMLPIVDSEWSLKLNPIMFYRVVGVANEAGISKDTQLMVVHSKLENGTLWSKPIGEFFEKFMPASTWRGVGDASVRETHKERKVGLDPSLAADYDESVWDKPVGAHYPQTQEEFKRLFQQKPRMDLDTALENIAKNTKIPKHMLLGPTDPPEVTIDKENGKIDIEFTAHLAGQVIPSAIPLGTLTTTGDDEPKIDSVWTHHKSKQVYKVKHITNKNPKSSVTAAKYPVTVVYFNITYGSWWSTPLDNFLKTMKRNGDDE